MLSKSTRNLETKLSIFHEKFNSLNRKMISIRQLVPVLLRVLDRLEYINAFATYRKYDGVATRTRQIRYRHENEANSIPPRGKLQPRSQGFLANAGGDALGPTLSKLHTPFHTPKSNLVPRAI